MTTPARRSTTVAVGLTAAVLSLSACSGDDGDAAGPTSAGAGDAAGPTTAGGGDFAERPPAEIRSAAVEAMQTLQSVTMTGRLSQNEQEVTLDLTLDTDGACTGTVSLGGAEAEILSTGSESYFRADSAFWEAMSGNAGQAEAMDALLEGKWAQLPSGQAGFADMCDLDQFLEGIDEGDQTGGDDMSEGSTTTGEVTEIEGQQAVELITEEDEETVHVWVATAEPHHILQMESEGGDDPGTFTFSEFDQPLEVQAPADDEVVDLSSFGG